MEHYTRQFNSLVAKTVQRAVNRAPAFAARLKTAGMTADDLQSVADLTHLAVLRKDDVIELQRQSPPFGGLLMMEPSKLRRIYQSPGPINEPEPDVPDYWRWKPALEALGVKAGDIVLNTFGYHLTPAGAMMEEGARAVGAAVIPGGIGNQDAQIAMLAQFSISAYIGLPSYLKALLDKAQELDLDPRTFALQRAFVTAEPLPPSLRKYLQSYGLTVRQGYGTAEAGNLGYECEAENGWHVPTDALVQVCDINTGEPLPAGEIGEVVVTLFNDVYALIRFGTGDLSAWNVSPCECGRESPRLIGWQGRIGDAVKVRGMFLHPKQAATVFTRFPEVQRYQFVITRQEHLDNLACRIMLGPGEASLGDSISMTLAAAIREALKFRVAIEIVDQIAEEAPIVVDERNWNE